MNDTGRTRGLDDGPELRRVERIRDGRRRAKRRDRVLLFGRARQRGDLMSRGDERMHQGNANGSRSSCDEHSHDALRTCVAHHTATTEPATSVATSKTAVLPNNPRHGSGT